MENLKINIEKIYDFVSKEKIWGNEDVLKKHNQALIEKTGKGNDFLGWTNLPSSIAEADMEDIETTAQQLRDKCDIVVVIGIGGSYLGARAVIESLSNNFSHLQRTKDNPLVLYAGQNISEDYLFDLKNILHDWSWSIVVISKSGTTTEPAIAFRVLKNELENKYGKDEAQSRIVAITDKEKGALRQLAEQEKYKTFVIPDDVGGRYSVLTPVGLLPIAIAGFDIRQLIRGAKTMEKATGADAKFEENPAAIYASTRNELYKSGKKVEILVNYNPKLHFFAEWWKQLYGESDGKENKGIFPAAVDFTSDLHSMGQYIQEGERLLFETVLSVKSAKNRLQIPTDNANLDKINYLAGKRLEEVNKQAETGTMLAHLEGDVPNIHLEIPELNEFYIGQLIYFFEKACGLGGYMLDINPFDQPGVEAYKKNMFALLEKPGFEEETKKIKEKYNL